MNRVNDVNLVQTVTEKSPLLLCGYLVGIKNSSERIKTSVLDHIFRQNIERRPGAAWPQHKTAACRQERVKDELAEARKSSRPTDPRGQGTFR